MKRLTLAVALLAGLIACDKKEAEQAADKAKETAKAAADKTAELAGKAADKAGAAADKAGEAAKAAGHKAAGAVKEAAAKAEKALAPGNDGAAKNPALMNPGQATATAPDTFTVKLETTEGDILIDVTREWAPQGADRFYNLVKVGYYDDVAFFRVIDNFMAQVGISGDPKVNTVWREARIQDDPVKGSNTRGMVTFAMAGPNTRTTQFFINFKDNSNLDGMRFAPFGKVQDASMAVVDKIYKGYGEGAPRGRGPSQGRLQMEGNAYLKKEFPELDYIKKASVVEK